MLSAYGTIAGEGIGRRRVGADAKASAYEEVEGEGARRRDETRRDETRMARMAERSKRDERVGCARSDACARWMME